MPTLKGAEIVMEFLIETGIPYFIGYPGHTVMELLDAAFDRQEKIKPILVRHEATAAFMADAYFRVTHKPIAIWTHTGPGAANALIGVANAFYDSSSMLVFTGEPWTKYHGRGAYQEMYRYTDAEQPALFRPVTKRSWQIKQSDVGRLPEVLARGYSLATIGRPGPVHFDITQEALVEKADVAIPQMEKHLPRGRIGGDRDAIVRAVELLSRSERPAILAGGGVLISEAWMELVELAELLGAPVATTIMGKSSISEDHALSVGTIGTWGTRQANKAMVEADVLLAVGSRFSETDTSSWLSGYTFDIPPTRLIHIDIDQYEIAKYYPTEIGIIGDARTVLREIVSGLRADITKQRDLPWVREILKKKETWENELRNYEKVSDSPINPGSVVRSIRDILHPDDYLVTDIGNHHKWFAQQFKALTPRTVVASMGFAAMGFGPCASLGVKLAKPKANVVCVCGDGGFMMVPHVLATAIEYDLPVVFCILNDFGLGPMRMIQKGFHYRGRIICSEFRKSKTGEPYNPDFAKMAEAYGCEGKMIEKLADFKGAFKSALRSGIPYVLDVRIDKEAKWLPSGGTWVLPSPT